MKTGETKMKTRMFTIALGVSTAFLLASCADSESGDSSSESNSSAAKSNSVPSATDEGTEDKVDDESSEPVAEDSIVYSDEQEVAAVVNLFLGTMGANTLYAEQIIDSPEDDELYNLMADDASASEIVSVARSGALFIEPIDAESMSDDELHRYILANFRNSALYAQTNGVSGQPLEIVVDSSMFYPADNGNAYVFIDYPVDEFLEKEGISDVNEYNVDTDVEQNDVVLTKVDGQWKIHHSTVDYYISGMDEFIGD